ncbi:Uncharacterized protein TCM_017906 [Theobroma cacao]|uniref:Uncharacterized protein n=1 Tax=Theobroma cacao TaxID=3641 RepID=A0A061ELR4_THECC|nr:Uncharacterized protein TCM_017906 [Theobroma cacao]
MGDAFALGISGGHRCLECLPLGSLCLEVDQGLLIEVAIEVIFTFQKLIAHSIPKDDVYPLMYKWKCNQKLKDFYKVIETLESS